MSSRAQTIFFLLIVFFFASGAGLLVYKNYSDYYQQKTQVDLETAATSEMPTPQIKKAVASSTPDQVTGWQTYSNSQYGFEFQHPQGWVESDQFFAQDGYIYFHGATTTFPNLTIDYPTGADVNRIANSDIKQNNCPALNDSGLPADRILGKYLNGLLYISDSCGADTNNYKFVINNKNYFIRLIYPSNNEKNLQDFKDIISTLKFTN